MDKADNKDHNYRKCLYHQHLLHLTCHILNLFFYTKPDATFEKFSRNMIKTDNFWLFINIYTCNKLCDKWFKPNHMKL